MVIILDKMKDNIFFFTLSIIFTYINARLLPKYTIPDELDIVNSCLNM